MIAALLKKFFYCNYYYCSVLSCSVLVAFNANSICLYSCHSLYSHSSRWLLLLLFASVTIAIFALYLSCQFMVCLCCEMMHLSCVHTCLRVFIAAQQTLLSFLNNIICYYFWRPQPALLFLSVWSLMEREHVMQLDICHIKYCTFGVDFILTGKITTFNVVYLTQTKANYIELVV